MKLTDEERQALSSLRDDIRNAAQVAKTMAKVPSETALPIADHALSVFDRLLDKPIGEQSDGYHTFNELYDHRIALFIALCAEVDARTPTGYVWRSHRHSNGTMFEGWFLMGIGTEPGDQITYHLPLARWDDTNWLGTERMIAPEFDGHTSADVLARLKRFYR